MKKVWVVVFLILVIPSILHASWELVATSQDKVTAIYMDPDTFNADVPNGRAVIWIFTEKTNGDYSKALIFFRLYTNEYCVAEFQAYDGQRFVNTDYLKNNNVTCKPISPNSLMDAVKIKVLEKIFNKNK